MYRRGDIITAKVDFRHMKKHDKLTITDVNFFYKYINTNIGITVNFKKFGRYFYTELEIQRRKKLQILNKYET